METENVEIIKAMVRNGLGHQHHPVAGRGRRREEQAVVLQPDQRCATRTSDRLALSEDEPPASSCVGSDDGIRNGAAASSSDDAAGVMSLSS
jgi:hypothetical protein